MKRVGLVSLWLGLWMGYAWGLSACSGDDMTMEGGPDAEVVVPDSGVELDSGTMDASCRSSFNAQYACGGNLVGMWAYSEACTDQDLFENVTNACPGAVAGDQTVTSTGTLILNLNGSFARSFETAASGKFTIPATCAPAGCEAFAGTLTSTATRVFASCTGTDGCECQVDVGIGINQTGTYSFSGGTLNTGPFGDEWWFCIEGDTMSYRGISPNEDSDVTYVLTR